MADTGAGKDPLMELFADVRVMREKIDQRPDRSEMNDRILAAQQNNMSHTERIIEKFEHKQTERIEGFLTLLETKQEQFNNTIKSKIKKEVAEEAREEQAHRDNMMKSIMLQRNIALGATGFTGLIGIIAFAFFQGVK